MPSLTSKLKHSTVVLSLAAALLPFAPNRAAAGDSAYLGEITLVGFNFCPRTTLEAAGQLLPIASYDALFSLFGTMYGGDGRTTFALPDLRGRVPIGAGQQPGLGNYRQGQKGGAESFALTTPAQLPAHNHMVNAVGEGGLKTGPGTDFLAITAPVPRDPNATDYATYSDGPPDKTMDPAMIANTGNSQAVSHRGPYLVMKWCVVTQGIYPSRS